MSRISSEKVLQIANTPWKSASGSPGASPRPRQPAVHRRRVVGGEHRQLPLALPRPLPNLGHREAVALAAGADLLPVGGGGGVVAGRVGAGEPSQPRPAIAVAVPPVYGHLQARLGEDVLVGAHGEAPPGVQAAAARLAFLSRDNATADADAGGGGGGVVAVVDGADRPGEVLELAEADGEHGVLLLLPVLLVGHLVAAAAAISPTAAPEQESDKKMQQPGHEQHHSQYHQDEHHRRANPRRTGHRPAAAAAILVAPDYSGDHHLRSNATLISRGEAHNALLS
ncbi:Os06g0167150 [Oryza sativa Japonica Group]|uniref:Os06g0167150 protein n=1 Tax=Oryza sativa subsp. japonica TaxID=39947 RepID=A0A0N7KLL4_ORYSJ|nr:Os06g0167150 [Oryza sativa Japonica Group]